ncbi:MAG: sugar phosphate nucleotidyltransferase [Bacilli bacterium]
MKNKIFAIILSGGRGTRFNNHYYESKVLYEIIDKPIILYTIDTLMENNIFDIYIICNNENYPFIKEKVGVKAKYFIQKEYSGTGGCLKELINKLKGIECKDYLIINGDTPIYDKESIKNLINKKRTTRTQLSFVAFKDNLQNEYGEIKRIFFKNKIVNQKNINKDKIRLLNAGVYLISKDTLITNIVKIKSYNHEYGITSLINDCHLKTSYYLYCNKLYGLNYPSDVSLIESIISKFNIKKIEHKQDIIFTNKDSIVLGSDVVIGKNVIIKSNNIIKGKSIIKDNTIINENCFINNSIIGPYSKVGPFTYLRENVILEGINKIGSFVELKNVTLGQYSKIPHLSYIGDADIGKHTNIGAGVITCNYNGKDKNKTTIGNKCFIGANSNLIAPLKIDDNVYIAAGSTIDQNIEKNTFVIERSKPILKENKFK